MTIRPLQRSEELLLREFLYYAIHVPPGAAPPDRSILQIPLVACYHKDWGRADDVALVAEQNGNAVGLAWLRQMTAENPGYGFLDESTRSLSISVLPGHRGQGIGTRLLERLLPLADDHAVSLSVQKSNPAQRLYQRYGFMRVREDDSELVMRRG